MFREMRRFKQALSEDEIRDVLTKESRGVLSVLGDDGYPYGVPVNFYYDKEKNRIYFHGAKEGHKIDAIRAYDKASFTVYDKGYLMEGKLGLNVRSVIIFGRVRFIDDYDEAIESVVKLSNKYYPIQSWIDDEVRKDGPRVLCYELIPEHITGKLVNES